MKAACPRTPVKSPSQTRSLSHASRKSPAKPACKSLLRLEHINAASEVRHIASTPQGKVWCAERDGSIVVRDVLTGDITSSWRPNVKPNCQAKAEDVEFCWCLLYEPNTKTVWSGWSTGALRVYNAQTSEIEKEIYKHAGGIYCMCAAYGHIFTGSNDFEVFSWDSQTCAFSRQFSGHKNSVRSLCVEGTQLFTGSDDRSIFVWDHVSGQLTRQITGHNSGVTSLAYVNGQLWSADEDGQVKVWDLNERPPQQCVHTLTPHTKRVSSLTFAHSFVLTTGVDKSICVIDPATYQVVERCTDHSGYVHQVAVVRQCRDLVLWSVSGDKCIAEWKLSLPNSSVDTQDVSAALYSKVVNLESELRAHREALAAANDARERAVAEACAVRDAAVRRLEETIASLTTKLDKSAIEHAARVDDLKAQIRQRDAAADHEASRVATLQRQLETAVSQRDEYSNQISHLKKEEMKLRHLEEVQFETAKTLDRLNSQLHDAEKRERDWEQQMRTVEKVLEDQRAAIRDARRTEDERNNRIQQLEVELRNAERATVESRAENDLLQMKLREKEVDLSTLMKEFEKLRADIAAKASTITLLQQRNGELVVQIRALEAQIQQMKSTMQQKECEINTVKESELTLAQKIESYKERCQEMELREEEFEFVIQSRSELVKRIWEWYNCCDAISKRAPCLLRASGTNEAKSVEKDIAHCKDIAKKTVADFLTDLEKMHLGTSPYYFASDPNLKYHLNKTVDDYKTIKKNSESHSRLLSEGGEVEMVRSPSAMSPPARAEPPMAREGRVLEVAQPLLGDLPRFMKGTSSSSLRSTTTPSRNVRV